MNNVTGFLHLPKQLSTRSRSNALAHTHLLTRLSILAFAVCSALIAGCATEVTGQPASSSEIASSSSTSATPRQTDARGKHLPFLTKFFERWNPGNDGTDYEPCTTLTADQISSLGLDPNTMKDVAIVDGQTARGCTWNAKQPIGSDLYLNQKVGNSKSLADYKYKYRNLGKWRPDIYIRGRQVGVEEDGFDGCTTYVQSGQSGVITSTTSTGAREQTLDEQCEWVFAFTEATIDQIPK